MSRVPKIKGVSVELDSWDVKDGGSLEYRFAIDLDRCKRDELSSEEIHDLTTERWANPGEWEWREVPVKAPTLKIPTPDERATLIRTCELEESTGFLDGWFCKTHKGLFSNRAPRCNALTQANTALGLLRALDIATEALEEVYDHYTPGSPGNGDTPSSAWMEVEDALRRLGYEVKQ